MLLTEFHFSLAFGFNSPPSLAALFTVGLMDYNVQTIHSVHSCIYFRWEMIWPGLQFSSPPHTETPIHRHVHTMRSVKGEQLTGTCWFCRKQNDHHFITADGTGDLPDVRPEHQPLFHCVGHTRRTFLNNPLNLLEVFFFNLLLWFLNPSMNPR